MPDLNDSQKVLRNDVGKRIAAAIEAIAMATKIPTGGVLGQYLKKKSATDYDAEWADPSSATPLMDGTASAGSSMGLARDDHVHPVDTSREAAGLGITGASVGDLVRVNAVDANGKPTSWKKVPLCEIKTNPNLLGNWYFVGGGSQLGVGIFPINQRGQTSYIGAVYGIDRWSITSGSSSKVEIPSSNDGIIFTNTSNTNRFAQKLPPSVIGKTVTLSALCTPINNARYAVVIPTTGGGSSTTTYTTDSLASVTFDVPAAATSLSAQIRLESSATSVKIHAMKLELGSEQTLAHKEGNNWVLNEIPDYGEELAKCQRYLQVFRTEALRPTYGVDFRPVMATDEPTLSTMTYNNLTLYVASSEP